MYINSPEKFADWFNGKYPGVHRWITTEDVNDMTVCELIGRYRYYSKSLDGETIRGILQYEQLRKKRSTQPTLEDKQELPKCKRCKQPLPPESERKRGRPKEYCPGCEPFRNTERYRRWRKHKKRILVKSISIGV